MPETKRPLRKPRPAKRRHLDGLAVVSSFPVVGIGASAGGYEAFTSFLESLSTDPGMAFVLIQHLDPMHEGRLTELPARVSTLPVIEVKCTTTVRRLTPAAQKSFSLNPTDLGRIFKDIKISLEVADLDQMILEAIKTLHFKECEVRDRSGSRHSLRIRPYRTKENKIEGTVLSLFDIDELKQSVDQISEIIWEPHLVLDREFRVVKASDAFYEKFRVRPDATEGKYLFELGSGQWNIPRLRALLKEGLPEHGRVRDFLVEHDFPSLGPRKILLNARRLDAAGDDKEMLLLAIRDVTDPASIP